MSRGSPVHPPLSLFIVNVRIYRPLGNSNWSLLAALAALRPPLSLYASNIYIGTGVPPPLSPPQLSIPPHRSALSRRLRLIEVCVPVQTYRAVASTIDVYVDDVVQRAAYISSTGVFPPPQINSSSMDLYYMTLVLFCIAIEKLFRRIFIHKVLGTACALTQFHRPLIH